MAPEAQPKLRNESDVDYHGRFRATQSYQKSTNRQNTNLVFLGPPGSGKRFVFVFRFIFRFLFASFVSFNLGQSEN